MPEEMADAERPTPRSAIWWEVAFGLSICALLVWGSLEGWRFYDRYLLPEARSVPTATPTVTLDPEEVRVQARLIRQVIDHVGAGIAFKQASRIDLAVKEFYEALALDPSNAEARQNLRELGVEPPPSTAPPRVATAVPTPSPQPTATLRPSR